MKSSARRGVENLLTSGVSRQLLHAIAPGHIFVSRSHPWEPQYSAIDFGIVRQPDTRDTEYLQRNLMAFFSALPARGATAHRFTGWVPAKPR